MNESIAEIKGIIDEIEMTENLIIQLKKGDQGATLEVMLGEMLRKKRNLIRELISNLIQSGIDFKEFKNLYQTAFEYLMTNEQPTTKAHPDLINLFKKAENLMAANR